MFHVSLDFFVDATLGVWSHAWLVLLILCECIVRSFHIAIFYYLPYILTLKYAFMVKEHNSYFFLVKVGGFVFKVEAMVSLFKELFLLKLNLMKLALINLALIKPSLIPDLRSTTCTQTIRVSKTAQWKFSLLLNSTYRSSKTVEHLTK
jgi:hypothetical protein